MKLLNIVLLVATLGIGVLMAAAAVIVAAFDANSYRTTLAGYIEHTTGRKLTIAGELALTLWPELAVRITDVTLANLPELDAVPMLRIDSIDLHLQLQPLLRREYTITSVVARGAVLHLVANAATTNWQGIIERFEHELPAVARTPQLATTHVQFVDAAIHYHSPQTRWTLAALELAATEDPRTPARYDLRAAATLSGSATGTTEAPQFTVGAQLDLRSDDPVFNALELRYTAQPSTAEAPVRALSAPVARFERASDTLHITDSRWQYGELAAHGDLIIEHATRAPSAHGSVQFGSHMSHVYRALNTAPPDMLPATGLGQLDLVANYHWRQGDGLRLTQLQLALPDLDLRAFGAARLAPAGQITATLTVPSTPLATFQRKLPDLLPVTVPAARRVSSSVSGAMRVRYDPQTTVFELHQAQLSGLGAKLTITGRGPLDGSEPWRGTVTLPAFSPREVLANLGLALNTVDLHALHSASLTANLSSNATGTLYIEELLWADTRITRAHATVQLADGSLHLNPLRGRLFNGIFAGDVTLTAGSTDAQPSLAVAGSARNINLGQLLQATTASASLTGTAAANLTVSGKTSLDVIRSANGTLELNVRAGTFTGVNLGHALCDQFNQLHGYPRPATTNTPVTPVTPFGALSANVTFTHGVARSSDIAARNAYLHITGAGSAQLARQAIDYDLNVGLTGAIRIPNCEPLAAHIGRSIPVKLTGSFEAPHVRPDFNALTAQPDPVKRQP